MLGLEWKKLSQQEKEEWNEKAKQNNSSKQSEDQSNESEKELQIRKESCPFCENHYSDKVA